MARPSTVLVIEENTKRRLIINTIGREYPVLRASSCEDALCIIHNAKPNVVVLDGMIPGITKGMSVLTSLKNDPSARSIPLILIDRQEHDNANTRTIQKIKNYLMYKSDVILSLSESADELLMREVRRLAGPSIPETLESYTNYYQRLKTA